MLSIFTVLNFGALFYNMLNNVQLCSCYIISSINFALLILSVILFLMLTLWSIIIIIKYKKKAIPSNFLYKSKLNLKAAAWEKMKN